MWAYADSLGLTMAGRRILRVIMAYGMSLSHKFNGKFGDVLANPVAKWFLNVCMALSALLRRYNPAGVS